MSFLLPSRGVFGPDGLSYENETWTGTAITDALTIGDHTTIDDLYATQDDYSFIVHPGDFAYADHWVRTAEAAQKDAGGGSGRGVARGCEGRADADALTCAAAGRRSTRSRTASSTARPTTRSTPPAWFMRG